MSLEVTISGVFAGIVGTILGFPFDTVKTKMQTNKNKYNSMRTTFYKIATEEGFKNGFYRGIGSPLISLTFLNMLNFSSYDYFKRKLGIKESTMTNDRFNIRIILAGAAAGPIAAFISTPFELIKTQLQISHKSVLSNQIPTMNSIEAAVAIARQHGIHGLYIGHSINTTREIVFLSTYFSIYEFMKSSIVLSFPNIVAIPLAGGISGAVGWFISFPLDCIKSNIQGKSITLGTSIKTKIKVHSVALELVKQYGIFGLYGGILPSVIRAFIVSSSRFATYEFVLCKLKEYK